MSKALLKSIRLSKAFIRGLGAFFQPMQVRSRRVKRQTDAEAIASDWIAIGNDIRKAMVIYGREQQQPTGRN